MTDVRPLGRLHRCLRAPLLHFLLLGGVMFFARQLWLEPAPSLVVEISAADVADLEDAWSRQVGRPPSAREREGILQGEVDERLLLEEAFSLGWQRSDAIALRRLIQNQRFLNPDETLSDEALLELAFEQGMDRSDIVVRRRLLERMRLAVFAGAREPPLTQAELKAHWRAHPEAFERPAQIRLSHVFLSRDRRGARLDDDARALGERLIGEEIDPADSARLGDPLLVPSTLPPTSEARLGRQLGADFARAAMQVPVGRWSGPIGSAYGLHFVFVHERTPATQPPLSAVEQAVRAEVQREREQAALKEHIAFLRQRAVVRLPEDGPPAPANASGAP